ncbi:hypothetical protein ACXHQ0_19135 [Vibrio antiquarius]|uniref:Uncharacterized protein n=2 Tax=Vibrio TaxID=662 RepID=A0A5Q6PK63_VIBCL|nr:MULTISPECIES: hypothetical protein [Vibrio]EQM48514.1 hypothetical protein D051_0267 [Vibrio parahaemolyticus VPCR-2010]KAA1255225.1 hypothetical protein F0M16_08385 [Vibrio cholerae]KOE95799.1 hypothetical protein ACS91_00495 [Vibrio parahaemolyticus]MCS0114837.1 hypothetical protein [Vibrio parahaemolyticus]MCS0313560.1 hypothetical protein [Vibrio diabolicus]
MFNLENWTDIDGAQHFIGRALGIIKEDDSFSKDVKWVYWGNNDIGTMLWLFLEYMVEVGYLLKNEEDQFKVNPNFDLSSYATNKRGILKFDVDKESGVTTFHIPIQK